MVNFSGSHSPPACKLPPLNDFAEDSCLQPFTDESSDGAASDPGSQVPMKLPILKVNPWSKAVTDMQGNWHQQQKRFKRGLLGKEKQEILGLDSIQGLWRSRHHTISKFQGTGVVSLTLKLLDTHCIALR